MISHVTIAEEAWQILETTYEGTKNMKDTKFQMLTTRFEELKMSEDESFDSFYGKLNKVVIGKFNFGEKMENSKIVRKILQSLPESFRTKATAIEESDNALKCILVICLCGRYLLITMLNLYN